MARAEITSDGEDAGGGRAGGEAAQVRGLDRGAVGHRIGEGHAEFDHVGAAFDQRIEDRRRGSGRGIADGDEDDERAVFPRKGGGEAGDKARSEEHTSELPSVMSISYAGFCLKKK